jgi:hypothetical protein
MYSNYIHHTLYIMFSLYIVEVYDKVKTFISNMNVNEIEKEHELVYEDNYTILKQMNLQFYIKHIDDFFKNKFIDNNDKNLKFLIRDVDKLIQSYNSLYYLSNSNTNGDDFVIENNHIEGQTNYIYYNNLFQDAIILKDGLNMNHFPELNFIKTVNDNIYNKISSFISKNTFDSLEQITIMLKTFQDNPENITEEIIEKWVNDNYKITNDIEYKIKSSKLTNLFLKNYTHKNTKCVSRLFSKVLLKMNVNKKRYSDGMYWYGLQDKTKVLQSITAPILTQTINPFRDQEEMNDVNLFLKPKTSSIPVHKLHEKEIVDFSNITGFDTFETFANIHF